jgi:4-diphosphocytidyl-2-C-methyl-D-erythritol kinase
VTLAAIYDVPAPAKLNLFLHVIGRREDGYHLLQSVFVLLDWCDALHLERRTDGRLHRHDLNDQLPADDLSLRAARALQQASGSTLGADISLAKTVPWGAGLGGGSSDAASTLLALNRLWGLNWSRQRLQQIALPLGADVPFFIGGHNAFVEGIGERLTPIPLAMRRFAVVKPPAAISTPSIFRSELLRRDTEAAIVAGFLADTQLQHGLDANGLAADFGRNDLQPVAESLCPEVTQVAQWLEARFGNSRMSGSGSAVFASVFSKEFTSDGTGDQPGATETDEHPLRDLPSHWVGRMCRSLDHHPLVGWAD